MNKMIIGVLLATATVLTAVFIAGPLGEELVRTVGKAVWYVPYALLISAIRCLKTA